MGGARRQRRALLVHRRAPRGDPGLADALPIVIGVVELPDTNGCRLIGDVVGCPPEVVEIGMPVALEWYDVDEGSVPCFRPRA